MSEQLGRSSDSQSEQSSYRRRKIKRRVSGMAGLLFLTTAGIGYAVESHTNDVAEGKLKTAEICHDIDSRAKTITEKIDQCMERGVPGGNSIGEDKLRVDEPISFLNAYVEAQKGEAAEVEPGRIVAWSVGIPAATAFYIMS